MDELVITLTESELKKTIGTTFKSVLASLLQDGIIEGYETSISIRINKNKATHLQTILEFHNSSKVQSGPIKPNKNEE